VAFLDMADPWAEFDADEIDLPRLEPEEKTRHQWRLKARSRRAILALLFLVIAYFVQTRVVDEVVYGQRQQHLAADLGRPKPTIEQGDALGYLQIPKIGLNDVMVEGVTIDHLRGGPARRSDSALPGDAGPMVVCGHRNAYGGPFSRVTDLVEGDTIVAEAASGGPIVEYVVSRVERHTDLAAVKLDKPDRIAYLLLVTAEPGWFAGDVSVVVARALPVTDAEPAIIDLGETPDRGIPLSLPLVLGNVSVVGAVLAWRFLATRCTAVTRGLVVIPIALYAAITVVGALEAVLPIAN
jgi:LPXTG-site transpeptidase (sortase) family protein